MWKIVGLTLGIGTAVGGLIGYLIHLMLKVNP
jgi:preprotein translocase subunit Sss1